MPLRAGSAEIIKIELYQVSNPLVTDPHLNLLVGEFQVRADSLPPSMALRKGDEVLIHWMMGEGQEITAEVEFPSVQQRFDRSNFYNWQVARQNFSGDEGAKLASAHLGLAQKELDNAEEAVPPAHAGSLRSIRERMEVCVDVLRGTLDPDTRRQVVEDVRLLRQDVALVSQHPEARREILRRRLAAQKNFYDRDIRDGATRDQSAQVDSLIRNATATIEQADFTVASELISRINGLYWTHGVEQDAFCGWQFMMERDNRHLATDRAEFDRSVARGNKAIEDGDFQTVRQCFLDIIIGQVSVGRDMNGPERAALMRA
jgi:hypothetical protein